MNQKRSKRERQNDVGSPVKMPKDKTTVITNVVIGCVIAAFVGLGGYAVAKKAIENKQNAVDESGTVAVETVADVAESKGMSVTDFLAEYGLPSNTSEAAAMSDVYTAMSLENLAKFSDTAVEDFRSQNFVPEDVTNDTAWGDVIPKLPFKAIVGEEMVEQYKSMYALDDSITADTVWGEVEPVLMKKQEELMAAMENSNAGAAEEAGDSDSEEKAE